VRTATATDSIRADWKLESQFAVLDPALVHVPTLLIDGERDPYANASNHPAVFARLGTPDGGGWCSRAPTMRRTWSFRTRSSTRSSRSWSGGSRSTPHEHEARRVVGAVLQPSSSTTSP